MKKTISITFIVLFLSLLLAIAIDANKEDYTDSQYVNNLGAEELVEALEQGKISDLSIIDDNRLVVALASNPSLLDKKEILSDFDQRVSKSVDLVNENPQLMQKWFAAYNIVAQPGVKLKSYDGSRVFTAGSERTDFDIDQHPSARVLASGKLVLASGTEVSLASVQVEVDGGVLVEGGTTDLTNSKVEDILIRGRVIVNGKTFASFTNKPIRCIKDGDTSSLEGWVVEIDIENKQLNAGFNGKVTYHADGHLSISAGTAYYEMVDGKKSVILQVSKDTDYFLHPEESDNIQDNAECIEEGVCYSDTREEEVLPPLSWCSRSEVSCIERSTDRAELKVTARNDNNIILKVKDYSVSRLEVTPRITDGSIVDFFDSRDPEGFEGVEVLFSKEPLTIKGDASQLFPTVITPVTIGGEEHSLRISDGETTICTDCFQCGYIERLPAMPARGSVVRVAQLTVNPVFKDKRGRDVGRFVEEENARLLRGRKEMIKVDPHNADALERVMDQMVEELLAEGQVSPSLYVAEGEDTAGSVAARRLAESIVRKKKAAQITVVTGHHHTGEGAVWGTGTKVGMDKVTSPGSEVLIFSACHTVMNPDYLRERVEKGETRAGGDTFQTAEAFVGQVQKNNPDIRLIIGWETLAPGRDDVTPRLMSPSALAQLESRGYKALGDAALKATQERWQRRASRGSEMKQGKWTYGTNLLGCPGYAKCDGHRMAYYYRGTDSRWKYYSLDHPQGVLLNPGASDHAYAAQGIDPTTLERRALALDSSPEPCYLGDCDI